MLRSKLGLGMCAAIVGVFLLGACGSKSGTADGGVIDPEEEELDASVTPVRDSATPVPPAFEGGIKPEDSGVGPPPDGGNDLSGCLDPGDPGGTEPTSKLLPNTDDCDKNKATVKGVIRGLADTDMYRLTLADKTFCRQDSTFKLDGTAVEFCAFIQCKVNGANTEIESCGGGIKKDSDIGLHGCCAGSPTEMKVTWNCSGTIDEQSDVYFRVKPTQNVCTPYTLTYNF